MVGRHLVRTTALSIMGMRTINCHLAWN